LLEKNLEKLSTTLDDNQSIASHLGWKLNAETGIVDRSCFEVHHDAEPIGLGK